MHDISSRRRADTHSRRSRRPRSGGLCFSSQEQATTAKQFRKLNQYQRSERRARAWRRFHIRVRAAPHTQTHSQHTLAQCIPSFRPRSIGEPNRTEGKISLIATRGVSSHYDSSKNFARNVYLTYAFELISCRICERI